jgi:hypothetical protein
MEYAPLSEEERIASAIVDASFTVHKQLGPGLLESVYEVCLCDGIKFEEGFRADLVVQERVICEIKAVDDLHPVHIAQLLTYWKLTGKRLGFLINFHVPLIKDGIRRIIR